MDNPALLRLIKVRLARQDDLPALEWEGELVHFRNIFYDAYEQARRGQSEIWMAELRDMFSRKPLLVGQLILSLRLSLDGRLESAYLYGFRVREQYRSQGVGSLLLRTIEDHLLQLGCTRVTLNVARDNFGARRLYERKDYCVIGDDEGHWFYTDHQGVLREVNEPAWRMEKKLT